MPRDKHTKRFANVRQTGLMPHWRATGAIYEIAFRIDGSLPAPVRDRIEGNDDTDTEGTLPAFRLPIRHLETLGRAETESFRSNWVQLDGIGLLADHRYAEIVQNVMLKGHGRVGSLLSWCVMPNHVHALVQPHDGVDLSSIVKTWKGCSAREINRLQGRNGTIWQRDYFDRIVRSTDELIRSLEYVLLNPEVAGLHEWQFRGALGLGAKLIRSSPSLRPLEHWCRDDPQQQT